MYKLCVDLSVVPEWCALTHSVFVKEASIITLAIGIAQLEQRRTPDRQGAARVTYLSVLILIRCPFHPRATAVTRRRPQPLCQTCRRQITTRNAHTLPEQRRNGLTMLPWHRFETYLGNEFTRNSPRTACPQSLNSLSHCGLTPGLAEEWRWCVRPDLHFKKKKRKKKKRGRGTIR